MAIVNTNTAPILQEGTNITLTQTGQTITITATDTTNAPGGSNTQVQFNDSGVFGGDAGLTYNKTTNVVSLESVDFATTPAAADAERRLKWDNDEGSLVLTLKGGNVTIPIGAEVVSLVYNAEATTLTKGTVVYAFGASGQRVSVKKAVNTADATSAQTFGVIAESIAAGAEGFCMVQGMVRGIDTSAYVQGDPIYLSATAGQFTKTKPVAPNHLVYIGFVVKVNASSGEIFVRPQNGYEMDEIHDYLEGSVQNNDVISYESSSGLYKPKSIPTLLGYTPANQATTITINGTSYDLSANRTWSVGTVTGTGTSGYVTYWDGTSSITGESNLFWDATNDRLGIGIATPSYLLDISSSSDPILGLYRTTNSVGFGIGRINWDGQNSSSTRVNYGRIQTEIASNTAGSHSGNLIFYTAGSGTVSSRMIISGDGNLGLGVTPSAWGSPFKVLEGGDGDNQGYFAFQTNANAIKTGVNHYFDGSNYVYKFSSSPASRYDINTDNFIWNLAISGTAGQPISFTQAMTLNASGQLAIGTTSNAWGSAFKSIQIGTGLSALSDSSGRATYLSNNWYYDTGDKYMAAYQATLYYQYLGAHNWLTAGTGSAGAPLTWTQAMTLDSSGRLGIGSSATSPTATLQIGTGIGTFDGLAIGGAANRDIRIGQSSTNNLVLAWKYNATAASAYALIETFGGSNNLILQGTGGNVAIGNTNANARLKVAGNGASGEIAGFRNVIYLYNTNTTSNQSNGIVFGSAGTGNAGTFALYTDLSADGTGVADLSFYNTAERMKISSTGVVKVNNLSGTGDRIVGTDSSGNLSSISVGSGLSLSGGTLTATGGSSGTVTASPNGANSQVAYFTSGTNITGSNNLTWDSTNSRLGIGTTSPGNLLALSAVNPTMDFVTTSTTTATMFQIIGASYVGSAPYNANRLVALNSSHIAFEAGASERMRVTSGGNVGIGVTTPSEKFTVNNSADNAIHILTTTSGNGRVSIGTDSSANALIRSLNSVDLRLGVGSDHLIIKSGGNVGINTTSPAYKLDVNGTFAFRATGYAYDSTLYAYNSSTNKYLQFTTDGTGGLLTMTDSTSLRLQVNGGNVGINTGSPSAKLVVEDGVANQTGAPTYRGSMIISNGGGATSSAGGLEFHAASSGSGYGWRVSTPDLGFGNIPVSYQSRTNTASWTERLRLNTSGQLQLNNYTSTTSFTGTVAGLLAFDSSGNVLTKAVSGSDTYETGTWNPNFLSGSGSFTTMTYSLGTSGVYVKIGNQVFISGYIATDNVSLGTAGGNLRISNLPYTYSTSTNARIPMVTFVWVQSWTGKPPSMGASVGLSAGTTFNLYEQRATDTVESTTLIPSDLTTGASTTKNEAYFYGSYFV